VEHFEIRQIGPADLEWISGLLRRSWASTRVVSRGRLYQADRLPGLVAVDRDDRIGLLTYSIKGEECEIVTLDSVREGRGVGSALVRQLETIAREAGCLCLRLVTTNDNLKALAFYQKRGFILVAIRHNAIEQSRLFKPEIPLTGHDGIPIRDELELELRL
jgi:DNA-3-methyladenine glycosylase I